jgi:hypothetical protein
MKKIKSYINFNEDADWKKALAGAALGAGLSIGNPFLSQTNQKSDTTQIKQDTDKYLDINPKNVDNNDILEMNQTLSIELPSNFDYNNMTISPTFMSISGFGRTTAIGGIIFINTPKLGFFIEIKGGFERESSKWVQTSYLEKEEYIYQNPLTGSYELHKDTETTYSGRFERDRMFNLGLSKDLVNNDKYRLNAYIGCGLTKRRYEMVEKINKTHSEWRNWLHGEEHIFSEYDYYKKSGLFLRENRLNISSGLIYTLPFDKYGLSFGIGFDTNPGLVNILFGINLK